MRSSGKYNRQKTLKNRHSYACICSVMSPRKRNTSAPTFGPRNQLFLRCRCKQRRAPVNVHWRSHQSGSWYATNRQALPMTVIAAAVTHTMRAFERVQHLVEPEALLQTVERLGSTPHLQHVLVIFVWRLRPVVAGDQRGIRAAPHELRRRRVAPLQSLGNHRRQRAREIRGNRERVRVARVEHDRVDRQIGDRPVNPLESAHRNRVGIAELPVQVFRLRIETVDVERE